MKSWVAFSSVLTIVAGCQGLDSTGPGPEGDGPLGKADGAELDPTVGQQRESCGHHLDGDRTGLHGMALFGREQHFLAHIPVFSRPHNEQLLLAVSLRDGGGVPVEDDFRTGGFSIRPSSPFSLDDLALRRLDSFRATVHEGNFEHGGRALMDVDIMVEAVLISRNLPVDEPEPELSVGLQEYFLVGTSSDAYLLNYIRAERPVQQILPVSDVEGVVPSLERVRRVLSEAPARLTPRGSPEELWLGRAGEDRGPSITLTIDGENWCLRGPDFFQPC